MIIQIRVDDRLIHGQIAVRMVKVFRYQSSGSGK